MPSIRLDLHALRRLDEKALEELYHITARSWGRRLSADEVRRIYSEGMRVALTGSGLYRAPELNYGLFVTRISHDLPLRWTLCCVCGNGSAHSAILQHHHRDGLIVAGSLVKGSFAGLSSTWIVHNARGAGRYSLGQFVNDAVLDHYRIPRHAGAPSRLQSA
jgi:hypothetical protein